MRLNPVVQPILSKTAAQNQVLTAAAKISSRFRIGATVCHPAPAPAPHGHTSPTQGSGAIKTTASLMPTSLPWVVQVAAALLMCSNQWCICTACVQLVWDNVPYHLRMGESNLGGSADPRWCTAAGTVKNGVISRDR
jgi:hypothetical protein